MHARATILRRVCALAVSAAMLGQIALQPVLADAHREDRGDRSEHVHTRTPIHHLIVVIGENHTFDNLFGGYRPPHGQTIHNLLSEGIINADGTPGPNFEKAAQQRALDADVYTLDPAIIGPYRTLPRPNTTYATGLPQNVPDKRFPADLPNGPFQITRYVPYGAYTGDPAHRFFQMWQQVHGGKMDLFTWVAQTVSIGPQNDGFSPSPKDTFQGGVAMGFYNMGTGDAPLLEKLARRYAISDNYHQPIMGGTGANFFAIVTGDVAFYNHDGVPTMPPANQIENPDPQPGTNNWYTQDGYRGGSYVRCADPSQAGVGAVRDYLHSMTYRAFRDGDCAPNAYYLVNNYGPGYGPEGKPAPLGPDHFNTPPQSVPTIAGALTRKGISWKWYSGGRNNGKPTSEYCNICDPLVYSKAVMTGPMKNNLQGIRRFRQDLRNDTLPAVAFVRPYERDAGHPANATPVAFGKFVWNLVQEVKRHKRIWAHTAILITTDEGGGYYDSGYVQAIDFFGDGTRIPFIVVSPYARRGYVDHTYYDHVSILKFIEHNWGLRPLSKRSRDNLPNPVSDEDNPYVPINVPAIGNLMDLFTFGHGGRYPSRQEGMHGDHHGPDGVED
mgnify:CR=1 FL=1